MLPEYRSHPLPLIPHYKQIKFKLGRENYLNGKVRYNIAKLVAQIRLNKLSVKVAKMYIPLGKKCIIQSRTFL